MKVTLIVGLLILLLAMPATAQQGTHSQKKDESHGGIGVSWYMPKGELKESHDSGYGVSLIFSYTTSDRMSITGNVAWSQYLANDQSGAPQEKWEDFTAWEFTSGPQFRFSLLYVGLEAGYYTHFDEWALVPNVGVRWKILDLAYRVKMGDETGVHSIRLGVFF